MVTARKERIFHWLCELKGMSRSSREPQLKLVSVNRSRIEQAGGQIK
jgi:hypothetical protein